MDAVGFIGLGQIGGPIASRLIDWPGGLVVCDVRPEATSPFADKGATVAGSASELAARCDVVSVMVRDDEQVFAVVGDILPAARPGTVVAIHSTIRPSTAEELAARAGRLGVEVVDAPVSGGAIGAQQGSLAVLMGGGEDAVVRCREPFGRFATLIEHFGPAGAGTRAKLARNLLQFVAFSAAGEAQSLAAAAGVDLVKLARVVRHSDRVVGGPGAVMIRDTTAPMAPGDPLYGVLSHARDLAEKDLALALELGDSLGVELPFAALARDRFGLGLGLEPGR